MGPHKIIQGEKRVQGKIQCENSEYPNHERACSRRKSSQEPTEEEWSQQYNDRTVTTQKLREKEAFQEEKSNTGKC